MILEISLTLYFLVFIGFFISFLRDKYVERNKVIILVYFVASLLWPVTGFFYLIDNRS